MAGNPGFAAHGGSFARPQPNDALARALQHSLDLKHAAQAQVDWQTLRSRAHAIKKFTIENLDRLLLDFERAFTGRGGAVLWASSGADAVAHVVEICRRHAVHSVVKGKSMLSEELDLNSQLQQAGITPVETDLGEYILQLAGQRPSHIVGPALHLSRQQIAQIFADKLGIPYNDEPQALLDAARNRLRQCYLQAGAGITGVNFAAADTGTIIVVENEGNGGLSAALPPVHICLMGIEKVIPRLSDAPIFLQLLARAATGQKLTSYTHYFFGPDKGKHVYCVLVDAGRSDVLADPRTRQALYCIRCGACLNVCPVYRRAGGWAYDSTYSGPIGAVITPLLNGVASAAELPFASSLCGACKQECPVDIDLPHQLAYLRKKVTELNAQAVPGQRSSQASSKERSPHATLGERRLMRIFAFVMQRPWRYALGVRALRWMLRKGERGGSVPGALSAWTKARSLPVVPPDTFKGWWRKRA